MSVPVNVDALLKFNENHHISSIEKQQFTQQCYKKNGVSVIKTTCVFNRKITDIA